MDKERGLEETCWLYQWLGISRIEYCSRAVEDTNTCIVEGCNNRKEKGVVLCGYHWAAYSSWHKTKQEESLRAFKKKLFGEKR